MEQVLKWWPLIVFSLVAVIAIGTHHEKIKQMKITELFRLWNSRK